MSKRSRDDETVPDPARSAARLKREDPDDETASTLVPDDSAPPAAADAVPAVVPNLDDIAKLLLEGLSSQDADTVENAASTLANMCSRADVNAVENRKKAWQYGAQLAAIQTMRKWNTNKGIQTYCCALVCYLLCGQLDTAKTAFFSIGGMELVVTAMRRFPDSAHVQRSGCGALVNLFSNSKPGSIQAFNRRFVQELNGVALVVKAMEKWPKVATYQERGCKLFYILAAENDLKEPIVKDGGSTAASKALQNDFGEKTDEVHKWAKLLMKRLFE